MDVQKSEDCSMSVAAAACPKVLTHYLRESPEAAAGQMNRRALIWDIAAKVTLAALFVITSAMMVMTVLGTAFFTPGYLTLAIGLAVATPLLYHFERKFANRSLQLKYDACVELGVVEYLKQLRSWKPSDFAAFNQKHHITGKMKQMMLLLIARFNFWQNVYENGLSEALLYLNDDSPKNGLANQPERHPTSYTPARFENCRTGRIACQIAKRHDPWFAT